MTKYNYRNPTVQAIQVQTVVRCLRGGLANLLPDWVRASVERGEFIASSIGVLTMVGKADKTDWLVRAGLVNDDQEEVDISLFTHDKFREQFRDANYNGLWSKSDDTLDDGQENEIGLALDCMTELARLDGDVTTTAKYIAGRINESPTQVEALLLFWSRVGLLRRIDTRGVGGDFEFSPRERFTRGERSDMRRWLVCLGGDDEQHQAHEVARRGGWDEHKAREQELARGVTETFIRTPATEQLHRVMRAQEVKRDGGPGVVFGNTETVIHSERVSGRGEADTETEVVIHPTGHDSVVTCAMHTAEERAAMSAFQEPTGDEVALRESHENAVRVRKSQENAVRDKTIQDIESDKNPNVVGSKAWWSEMQWWDETPGQEVIAQTKHGFIREYSTGAVYINCDCGANLSTLSMTTSYSAITSQTYWDYVTDESRFAGCGTCEAKADSGETPDKESSAKYYHVTSGTLAMFHRTYSKLVEILTNKGVRVEWAAIDDLLKVIGKRCPLNLSHVGRTVISVELVTLVNSLIAAIDVRGVASGETWQGELEAAILDLADCCLQISSDNEHYLKEDAKAQELELDRKIEEFAARKPLGDGVQVKELWARLAGAGLPKWTLGDGYQDGDEWLVRSGGATLIYSDKDYRRQFRIDERSDKHHGVDIFYARDETGKLSQVMPALSSTPGRVERSVDRILESLQAGLDALGPDSELASELVGENGGAKAMLVGALVSSLVGIFGGGEGE